MIIWDNNLKAYTGLSNDDRSGITFPNNKLYLTDLEFWEICDSNYVWKAYSTTSVEVVIPDGADFTQGNKTDVAMTDPAQSNSIVSILKGIFNKLGSVVLSAGNAIIGKVGIDQTTDGLTNRVVSKISQNAGENTVTIASGQNVGVTGALPSGTNNIGKVTIDSTTSLPTGTNSIGNVGINAGNNVIGKVSIDQSTPGNTNGVQVNAALPTGNNTIGGVNVMNTPSIKSDVSTSGTGGINIYRIVSLATTNGANIKTSSGRVYGWQITNSAASARFVKLYNLATSPTVGTSTVVLTIALPANTTINYSLTDVGIGFSTGIAVAITGALVDSDTTAVSAGDVILQLFYA